MESISIILDDGTGKEYDAALKGTLPECGDLKFITKDKGTQSGNPIVLIAFTVQLPDGTMARAQAATTAKCIDGLAKALRGKYGDKASF